MVNPNDVVRKKHLLRQVYRTDLLALCTEVLGYKDVSREVHGPILDALQKFPGGENLSLSTLRVRPGLKPSSRDGLPGAKAPGFHRASLCDGDDGGVGRQASDDQRGSSKADSKAECAGLASGQFEYRPFKEIRALEGARRLLVLYPRGHLKTTIVTIAHTIQWIINYPDVRILISTATGDQAQKIMREIRTSSSILIFDFCFRSFVRRMRRRRILAAAPSSPCRAGGCIAKSQPCGLARWAR